MAFFSFKKMVLIIHEDLLLTQEEDFLLAVEGYFFAHFEYRTRPLVLQFVLSSGIRPAFLGPSEAPKANVKEAAN